MTPEQDHRKRLASSTARTACRSTSQAPSQLRDHRILTFDARPHTSGPAPRGQAGTPRSNPRVPADRLLRAGPLPAPWVYLSNPVSVGTSLFGVLFGVIASGTTWPVWVFGVR